jgi:hypothetical protein
VGWKHKEWVEYQEGYKLKSLSEVTIRASHGFMGKGLRCCGPRTVFGEESAANRVKRRDIVSTSESLRR